MNANTWNIPWEEFEISLGLKNFYKTRNLNVHTPERAEALLKNCGFDLNNSTHLRQFDQLLCEALFFIRGTLLNQEEKGLLKIPQEILHYDDPRILLELASTRQPRRRYKRLWVCALLKVICAISNLQFSDKLHIINDAREQIFKRIKSVLDQRDEGHITANFNDISVPLRKIEWKEAKTRNSIILKLLHKSDSIVDEVFDYLGVRFVVPQANDIPFFLKLLIEADIIIPHQVVSVRTRNSLLGVKNQKKTIQFLNELYSSSVLNEVEFNNMCKNISWQIGQPEEGNKRVNLFTHQNYKSMQFTVRHLVRTVNPSYLVLASLTNQLNHYIGTHKQDPWMETVVSPQLAHYFPIEIQIMDEESYELAKFGVASHEQYKANQLKAVRDKVLGGLLSFDTELMKTQEI